MERAKYKIAILLFFIYTGIIHAGYKSDIYTAYISNNMQIWKRVIDKMQTIQNKDHYLMLELINYQYGYIGWCIGTGSYDEARSYLGLAEKNLIFLSKDESLQSIVNAYQAAFYGYKIGLNNMLAPFIGLKSIDAARTAVESDPGNPLAFIQQGNIKFYTPPVFGGSKNEAIYHYLKAEEIMEKDTSYLFQNWNYLNLLVVIAQTYSYLDDFESSKKYIDKILRIEPDIHWVKDALYPQILLRMKNKG